MAARTFRSPSFSADWTTKREWQQAEMPAINGHGNARSVAQIQYALANKGVAANGYRLLSEKTTELIYTPYIEGKDLVLRTHCVYGMGYGITGEHAPMSPNAKTAFWGGWGGSLVVVDAQAQLCISYVMNRMKPTLTGDTRGASIIRSTYACLKNLK
ncbi:MAG: serine hydrolase [Gammaproteobacteria bacterium]